MPKVFSPEQQWVRLRSCQICRGHGMVRNGELIWNFEAQPSVLSRTYQLKIRYKRYDVPEVFVLSPNLNVLANGRHLPHVYSEKPVKLCLHFPESKEWTSDKSIAETIVPWSYLWLMYFECWLATDEWLGGGRHPGETDVTK